MECPKCKAHNADDAVCCSLCYETFKAKPAKSPTAGGSGALAAFAEVVASVEGFRVTGPMVIGDNGIHFFIKAIERADEQRAGTMIGDQLGGVVGGLIGAAINSAVDSSTEAPIHRPNKLIYKPALEAIIACQKVQGDAPDIPRCKEMFSIEKKDIKSVSFGFLGGMTLTTQYLEMGIHGADPKDKATAYLKLKGYPLS